LEFGLSINRPDADITVTMPEASVRDVRDPELAESKPASSILSLQLVRAPVMRAALLWLALHVFVAAATGGVFVFGMAQSRLVVVIAAAVGYFDSRRRRESTFAGNLGVPSYLSPAMWAATVIVLEIVLRMMSALLD
jgi:hypothetical protein